MFDYPRYIPYIVKDGNVMIDPEYKDFFSLNYEKKKDYSNAELPEIKNANLKRMEDNCSMLNDWIYNSKDLNHLQRSYLMFIYLRFGSKGEDRLIEILKTKPHYDERITKLQIEFYKHKNRFMGVSCKTLIQAGLCGYVGCINYDAN